MRFTLILTSVIISILITELSLALINFPKIPIAWGWTNEKLVDLGHSQPMFVLDETTIYRPNTNVYYTEGGTALYNEHGSRPTGKPYKNNKALTIHVIGDSFTWGFELEHDETLPYFIEASLRNAGVYANVLNYGANGYGPDQELLYLKTRILPTSHPDMVIWNFNLNDADDMHSACLFAPDQYTFKIISAKWNTSYIQGFLTQILPTRVLNSHVGNLIVGSVSPRWTRHTFSCSKYFAPGPGFDEFKRKKLAFLLNEFQTLSEKNSFIPVLAIAPNQIASFPKKYAASALAMTHTTLLQTLIDSHILTINPSVAVEASSSTGSEKDFFLDEGKDSLGYWHPKMLVNKIAGQFVVEKILTTLNLDTVAATH